MRIDVRSSRLWVSPPHPKSNYSSLVSEGNVTMRYCPGEGCGIGASTRARSTFSLRSSVAVPIIGRDCGALSLSHGPACSQLLSLIHI